MSFLLFINCCLTAFGPLFILFKGTSLSESSGTAVTCGIAALGYFFSRAFQSLLIVSTTPEWISSTWILDQAVRALTNFVDAFGIYFILKRRIFSSFDLATRLLGVGLGWAAADALANHLIWFIVEARRAEFSWTFIEKALSANLSIISHITLTVLVHLWSKSNTSTKRAAFALAAMCFHIVCIPFIMNCIGISPVLSESAWIPLLSNGVLVLGSAATAKFLFSTRSREK